MDWIYDTLERLYKQERIRYACNRFHGNPPEIYCWTLDFEPPQSELFKPAKPRALGELRIYHDPSVIANYKPPAPSIVSQRSPVEAMVGWGTKHLKPALEPDKEPKTTVEPKTELAAMGEKYRSRAEIRAAIESALAKFEEAGEPFTLVQFFDAAGLGNSTIYTKAYEDLKARLLELKAKLDPPPKPRRRKDRRDELRQQIGEAEQQIRDLEQRNKELRKQLAQSQQAIAPTAEQAIDLIGALRAEAVRWERQIEKYHTQLDELGADLKAAEENLSAVNRLLAIHESEVVKPASNGHHAHTVLSKP
ncbi:MAG TPA: hypothetical protein V6C88_04395 [Chroococcidiopsis sp.]